VPTAPPNRPIVAIAILGAIGLAIGLVIAYAEPVSDWLGRFLPSNALPIPAAFFTLAFALWTGISVSNWRQARASAGWPSAVGRITRSEAVKEMMYPGTAKRGTKVAVFTPVVEFEYSAGGQQYRGGQIQFGATVKGEEAEARDRIAKYPVGRELPVRYDPAHPATAVIESTIAYPIRTVIVTVIFAVLALYFGGAF